MAPKPRRVEHGTWNTTHGTRNTEYQTRGRKTGDKNETESRRRTKEDKRKYDLGWKKNRKSLTAVTTEGGRSDGR